jgi:hypothetical protein
MTPAPGYEASGDTRGRRLAALAACQHGLVTRAQLDALGFPSAAIGRRVRDGHLHRLHRAVYAVGHTKISVRARWLAATLACGPHAVLSHRAAAALYELRAAPSGLIDVTAPARHRVPGVRCHFVRRLDPADATTVDGIPVTTLARLFLDLSEQLPTRQLNSTLEAAQRAELLNVKLITAQIDRSNGRRGVKPLAEAIEQLQDEPPWTQSELERRFRALTQAAGLPPPGFNVIVDGELVDCFWPHPNLVVEVDGWRFHKTRKAFEDDRRRDAKLVAAGRRVVRFTYRRVRDEPHAVARELSRLLNGRAGSAPGRSDQ